MKIVLATTNRKKVEEIRRIFKGFNIRFDTLDIYPGCPDVVEDGRTFRANARKKAIQIATFTGCPAIADDSGLEVDALGGSPGVFSARYAGTGADDHKNVKKLLKELATVRGASDRKARFVCCIAFALPDGHCKTFSGYSYGSIGKKERGFNGFGYDPVFFPKGYDRTFAELSGEEKDALSHRGKALQKLYYYLRDKL